jgi:hypothetical protein
LSDNAHIALADEVGRRLARRDGARPRVIQPRSIEGTSSLSLRCGVTQDLQRRRAAVEDKSPAG